MVSSLAPVGSVQSSIVKLTDSPISCVGRKPTHILWIGGGRRGTTKEIGAKLNVSSTVQSRAPSPSLRTTKSGSGSGKGYKKRLPCTSEHIKPTWRINEREERDG
jgi:hypothetical protein